MKNPWWGFSSSAMNGLPVIEERNVVVRLKVKSVREDVGEDASEIERCFQYK